MTLTLLGFGTISWTQVQALAGGLTCAWSDYTGFHVGDCPDQVPPYSHLWGWSLSHLLRARIDGDDAVVGILARDAPAVLSGTPVPEPSTREPVDIEISPAMNFAPDSDGSHPEKTVLVRVLGPMPLTFVTDDPLTWRPTSPPSP